ncbi:glycogen/starch/alpha-glucan phosphorylase [Oleispirillum naphthae]|uniref:glycogen/starch/alpha-glucan phosphorylase n=1 Tax=Oleispirillum naphthae TaxID=2838853 RepID=UPI0030823186
MSIRMQVVDDPKDRLFNVFEDTETLKKALMRSMIQSVGRSPDGAELRDWFLALAHLLRFVLSERNVRTSGQSYAQDKKLVYYLSMEYLIGRSLKKVLIDLGVMDVTLRTLDDLGLDFEAVQGFEYDAALGNGGLGRLAACFLDSLFTHDYPGIGYGIRYEYGMFTQRIEEGQQLEQPENWLRYGNPWEVARPSVLYKVRLGGRNLCFRNANGEDICQWVDAEEVMAMAFDSPVSGFDTETVGNLRLWSARSTREFDLQYFNQGNYIEAVRSKTISETLSKVLYPNDKSQDGQELRLKQEYFFVSASLQDILHRYLRTHENFTHFAEKVAIQLNDTHPAMAVAELMRLLIDDHGMSFEAAWAVTRKTFAYTNHTLLPEALETWAIDMVQAILPRHLEIIYQINDLFLREVRRTFPGDPGILSRVSLVDDATHRIRMAHLAVVGSHKVNGVAALHTQLLREGLFADFARIWPEKFVNMTNGITPRRWLRQSNPELSALITEAIGKGWEKDLDRLHALAPMAGDAFFQKRFQEIKFANKQRLAKLISSACHVEVNPESLFDTQVKRFHEYKRQLLNVLQVISRYNRLKDDPKSVTVPRTVIFAGKAAPGYDMAKLIIRLVLDVAETVNHDRATRDMLKVVFIPDYKVSSAETIIPGSELSEQISTAGTEASGTGNMKFALNGALTIGTMDGANIEIHDEVGADNIFIFGLDTKEAKELRSGGYDPWEYYNANEELRRTLDMVRNGYFSPNDPVRYKPLIDSLLRGGDHFLLLADYADYVACQEEVDKTYLDRAEWTRRAILNVANMGKFSSDRTIHEYAKGIWGIKPLDA